MLIMSPSSNSQLLSYSFKLLLVYITIVKYVGIDFGACECGHCGVVYDVMMCELY